MSQVKIYGIRENLVAIREKLSDVIHASIIEVLGLPRNKRAHRFFYMEKEDFFYPDGRTDDYIILEIMMIEGRSVPVKKRLIYHLFQEINDKIGLSMTDIEICIIESPASNWGFRGKTGDEVSLNYKIEI